MTRLKSFDLSSQEAQKALEIFQHEVLKWWESLPQKNPAGGAHSVETLGVKPGWEPAPALCQECPQEPQELETLFQHVTNTVMASAQTVGHGGYWAYVAGAANFPAALAQALAHILNPYTGTWSTAPDCLNLEGQALAWLCEMAGFPKGSGGVLTTGSSLALLSAVIAARENHAGDRSRARVYLSDQTHHAVSKALFAAGFLPEQTVVVASRQGVMDVAAVERQMSQDKAQGLEPMMLVASAGHTNTGCVDDLEATAQLAQKFGVWFHVDGAYGAFFHMVSEKRHVLKGMEKADSLSIDPHKSLCFPYGTGALLIRQVKALRFPRGLHSSYMPPWEESHGALELSDLTPELSRDWRGLRVWMGVAAHGKQAFADNLSKVSTLAGELAAAMESIKGVRLVSRPHLSLFAFYFVKKDEQADDQKTKNFLKHINLTGRFFLTSCQWENRVVIRVCLLGFRVTKEITNDFLKILEQWNLENM